MIEEEKKPALIIDVPMQTFVSSGYPIFPFFSLCVWQFFFIVGLSDLLCLENLGPETRRNAKTSARRFLNAKSVINRTSTKSRNQNVFPTLSNRGTIGISSVLIGATSQENKCFGYKPNLWIGLQCRAFQSICRTKRCLCSTTRHSQQRLTDPLIGHIQIVPTLKHLLRITHCAILKNGCTREQSDVKKMDTQII